MKKLIYATTILVLSFASALQADNRIVISLVAPPPDATEQVLAQTSQEQTDAIGKKIDAMADQTPSNNVFKNLKYSIKNQLIPKLSGFAALYGGYCEFSNRDGTISLPLRHTAPKLYIAITPDFTLVRVKEQTFSHAEYKTGVPTVLYQLDRIKDQSNLTLWDIKEIPLPANKNINPLTVILLTKPNNLYIPTGKFLTPESTHLVIPDIYVVGYVDNDNTLLQALDQKIYFEPIQRGEVKANATTTQSIVPNL